MGKLFNEFMKYWNSTSEEQKERDWEQLKEYNTYSPVIKLEE